MLLAFVHGLKLGTNARVAEQVPGAADVLASFEDHVTVVRTLPLQVHAGSDAGYSGTDHDYVVMLFHAESLLTTYSRGATPIAADSSPA